MKKSFQYYVRTLHRDLGFLTVGLIIFYALSGIILIYRDTDFLKHEVAIEKTIAPHLASDELAGALRLRSLKIIEEDSTTITFTQGTYSKTTGAAAYITNEVIFPFNKFIALHKAASQSPSHWFTTLFGVILFLLALSSFWMFKSGTRQFKRGLILSVAGIATAILLLFIV